jgi:TatD DNase family protein
MDNLYDTHFHLDLQESKDDILREIESNKVYTIAVTNLPPIYENLIKSINSKFIRVALGFHPELVGKYQKYILDMWRLLPNAKYIGEVGMDLKTGKETKNIQVSFFEELINKCNTLGNKVISIHSRAAASEVISIIGENFNGKIILHWYSGTYQNQQRAIDNGYYFSVNHAMLGSNSGREIILNIPEDRILIETDSPFTSVNGHAFKPSEIELIITGIGKIMNKSPEIMKDILWKNFKAAIS